MLKSANTVYIKKLVHDHTGVLIPKGKEMLISSRLSGLVSKSAYSSVDELLEQLRAGAARDLLTQVLNALMTNETRFFREPYMFDLLKDILLPRRVEANGGGQANLNIWSGACSSGQEVYSIAITLAKSERGGDFLRGTGHKLFASDVSESVLNKAKQGSYNDFECGRGLNATDWLEYFTPSVSNEWTVNSNIKRQISFKSINLIKSLPHLPQMDIIFLRNVLIYFDDQHKTEVLQKIKNQLKPGGFLVVGTGESPDHYVSSFNPVKQGRCIFYQRNS